MRTATGSTKPATAVAATSPLLPGLHQLRRDSEHFCQVGWNGEEAIEICGLRGDSDLPFRQVLGGRLP